MAISYKKLWKLIIDKDMANAEVRRAAHIGPSTFSRMKKNEYVTLEVLDKLCDVLNCDIGDIVERVPEDNSSKRTAKVEDMELGDE